MNYNNKKAIVSVIYRFPKENSNETELFLSNFEKLLNGVKKVNHLYLKLQEILIQDLSHGGLMTSLQQRNCNYSHLLHQMGFLN